LPTILIVDDRSVNRELLNVLLTSKGHRILEAGDGVEGLKVARESRPDVIFSDVMMPHMNGFQFAQELLLYPETADIPVILTSAYRVSERTEVMAAAYGVKYVLRVPIEPEVIFKAVDKVLAENTNGHLQREPSEAC